MVAGPSGVGKGTVIAELQKRHPDTWLSVSATTRAPREGEVDGVSYFFYDRDRFEELVRGGEMLEWDAHFGHLYGTPRQPVEQHLAAGHDVILEIDVEGARQVQASAPEALLVFIAPPSREELVRRLRARGTEDSAELEIRIARAEEELAAQTEFDRVIINHDVGQAVAELVKLTESPS